MTSGLGRTGTGIMIVNLKSEQRNIFNRLVTGRAGLSRVGPAAATPGPEAAGCRRQPVRPGPAADPSHHGI